MRLLVPLLVATLAVPPRAAAQTGRSLLTRGPDGRPLVWMVRHELGEASARGAGTCAGRTSPSDDLQLAVLLPEDDTYESSWRKVAPAIVMALQRLRGRRLLPGRSFTLHVRDTRCSSIYAPAHAVQAYFNDRVALLLGPTCDFSLAPVARLVKFWNVPLITAGGLSHDFGMPKTQPENEYYMTTRTGFSFNGIAATIGEIITTFQWRKVMLMYEKNAYQSISGYQTCYLAMSSVVEYLKAQNVSYGAFDLEKNQHFTLRDNLRSEIGFDYGGAAAVRLLSTETGSAAAPTRRATAENKS